MSIIRKFKSIFYKINSFIYMFIPLGIWITYFYFNFKPIKSIINIKIIKKIGWKDGFYIYLIEGKVFKNIDSYWLLFSKKRYNQFETLKGNKIIIINKEIIQEVI